MQSTISARRHGEGGRGALVPSGKVVKCFCALVVPAKRSVDELFMHHFHNLSSAYGGFQDPHRGAPTPTPSENFRHETPNLPTPGKNPAGALAVCLLLLMTSYMHHTVRHGIATTAMLSAVQDDFGVVDRFME